MICPIDEDLLPILADDNAADEVRGHLDTCFNCQQRLRRLQAEVLALRHAVCRAVPSGPSPIEETSAYTPLSSDSDRADTPETPCLPATSPAPATIGKYLIVGLLDGGGQAWAYRAVHPALGKELVVKLSRVPLRDHPAERDRLVEEGRLLANLEHPYLARVYDLDVHQNYPFLVLEYVRGRNLEQYTQQERPTPRQAAVLVAKVARALGAAHRQGVIHQDIKPRNILVDEAGQPRLIDFGMARLRSAWSPVEEPRGRISGTPAYMAPEQARGETEQVTARSDLFALGSVLYQLLVHKAPFADRNQGAALDRAARCDFDGRALRAAGVPRRLEAICLRAMAKEPGDRYARADDLADDLERFLRRPERLGQVLAVAATVLLVALGAWWLFSRAKAPPSHETAPAAALAGTPQDLIQVHRQGQILDLKDAVPLRSGDRLWIRGQVPRGLQVALFWLDSEGQLSELAPLARSPGESVDRLFYPPQGAVPLEGQAGTEMVLLCASASEPPGREAVATLLASDKPWAALPPLALVRLTRDNVEVTGMVRGVGSAEWDPVRDVQQRLDQVRLRLRDRFAFLIGVAFAHQN